MSFNALRKKITDHMIANWTGTDMDRVRYGNESGLNIEDGAWVRLSHTILSNANAEVGTNFQRAVGFINVQIFTEEKTGEKLAFELVDAVVATFQNERFNGVTCFACTPINIGRNGTTYQMNTRVDFQHSVFS